MTERRVRRRLTMWLVAALLAVAGAFTAVTPANAATTCTLTFKANYWRTVGAEYRWTVEGTLTNTGTASSTAWAAVINLPFSSGAVVRQSWNVTRVSTYDWAAAAWNKVIPPGQRTSFGMEVGMPVPDVTPPLPTSSQCSITY